MCIVALVLHLFCLVYLWTGRSVFGFYLPAGSLQAAAFLFHVRVRRITFSLWAGVGFSKIEVKEHIVNCVIHLRRWQAEAAKAVKMMELSHSLLLNETALAQIPEAKRPVFVFEWLRFLDKVLVAAQKVIQWRVKAQVVL